MLQIVISCQLYDQNQRPFYVEYSTSEHTHPNQFLNYDLSLNL